MVGLLITGGRVQKLDEIRNNDLFALTRFEGVVWSILAVIAAIAIVMLSVPSLLF